MATKKNEDLSVSDAFARLPTRPHSIWKIDTDVKKAEAEVKVSINPIAVTVKPKELEIADLTRNSDPVADFCPSLLSVYANSKPFIIEYKSDPIPIKIKPIHGIERFFEKPLGRIITL